MGYTKLFESITRSSIWEESVHTRIVWITLLALADENGEVRSSVPGLARTAYVTLEQCEVAIGRLSGPDPHSSTPDLDGRRIVRIDGGWSLVNHSKYKMLMSLEERRARDADRKRNVRGLSANVRVVPKSPQCLPPDQTRPDQNKPEVEAPKPPPTDAKRFTVPDGFEPSDTHRFRCRELKIDIDDLLKSFKLQEFNRAYSDWPRRFSKWIEDEKLRRETDKAKSLGKKPKERTFADAMKDCP